MESLERVSDALILQKLFPIGARFNGDVYDEAGNEDEKIRAANRTRLRDDVSSLDFHGRAGGFHSLRSGTARTLRNRMSAGCVSPFREAAK